MSQEHHGQLKSVLVEHGETAGSGITASVFGIFTIVIDLIIENITAGQGESQAYRSQLTLQPSHG